MLYLRPSRKQALCRQVYKNVVHTQQRTFDRVTLWVGDAGTGAGGIAELSYSPGLDNPEQIAAAEKLMQRIVDKINEAFDES